MADRLAGKIALVTGIGAGIGQAIGLRFAREGALVVGCDISPSRAKATAAAAAKERLSFESVHPIDLTKPADVERYVEFASSKHGRIDVVVNAAAITPHLSPIETMVYEKQWVPTIVGEVDLVFLMIRAVWPHLLKAGGGSIINFASVAALRAGGVGMVAHCAGKAAVLGMSRQVAVEGGPFDIRCNTIAPGWVQTAATAAVGAVMGDVTDRIIQRLAIKRLGQPEDIANAALFLASDESTWVTGANFSIDGGAMAS
jgi:NAD(P)-dependent dehydrogenase (short-subunit alcohol dehydrogenase family)